ncbi:MAG: hypothetical protein R2756_16265 [Bacteroidales bacterium]
MILPGEGTGLEYFDGRGGYKVYMHSQQVAAGVESGNGDSPTPQLQSGAASVMRP